jgi:hypothetical protein
LAQPLPPPLRILSPLTPSVRICRNWDADSFLQQALSDALERHAAIYACVFLPPGPDGLELLAAGYSSGGIRCACDSKGWLQR